MREGKVIKFSLVGAIGVLLLIIAIIVGLIIGIPKLKNKEGAGNKSSEQEQIEVGNKEESKGENEKDRIKTNVIVNGDMEEIILKKYNSSLGYTMYYDEGKFYIEYRKDTPVDRYESLYSNSIVFLVSEREMSYEASVEALNRRMQESDNINNNSSEMSYNIKETALGNSRAIEEITIDPAQYIMTYIVEDKNDEKNCFYIEIRFNRQFEETMLPVVREMLKTFEVE